MEDEKLLPPGEPNLPPLEPKPVPPPPRPSFFPPAPAAEPQSMEEKQPMPGVPSAKQQSWGVVISIVIIVMMVVIGAFYAWGQRVAQNQQTPAGITQ